MNDKMNDPECVTRKVKISPHDYLKENLLATFTPQKQLTPEQIFWSNELMKLKFEALQERTKVSRPIKVFTVPRHVTSKRSFHSLKHSTEVAQYAVDRKYDAIELKNLLIANDNLIAACLSQEVFSMTTNSELNVARFTEMHVANTTVEACCLALEAELDKDTPDFDYVFVIRKMQASLQGKDNVIRQLKKQLSQLQETRFDTDRTPKLQTTDSQTTKLTKLTSHVTHIQAQNDLFRAENDKIKQHYNELYDSINITRAKHIEHVTKLTTKNVNMKTSVSKDKVKLQVLTREKHAIDVEPIVPRLRNNRDAQLGYLRHLKESVETIHDIVEEAKVLAHIPLIKKKQVTIVTLFDKSDGVNRCPKASGSQPKSNPRPNRISPAKGVNKLPKVKQVWKPKQVRQVWKPTGKVLTTIGHQWRPTGQILNLGKQCPLTRFTPPKVVSAKQSKKRASRTDRPLWHNQSDALSHKFVTQSMTTTLSIENRQSRSFILPEYLANVTKHRRFIAGETRSAQDSHALKPAKPARWPKQTTQKDRINILQYLIHLRMCKDFPTKMMKMFLLVENLRQQNPNNHEWVFNLLVHSSRALSALRRSGLRTASKAAKPYQGDSLKFYLITGSIHTDQRRTVLLAKKDVNLQLHAHTSKPLSLTAKRPTTQLSQL
uniref:Integrase, catalytic region, zinc finger, CCHC-type, peptidase aspartic, catalytic n=1 Tax=Tanacetum cinerariifolium TaxID=118510 RepID=A0A6L2J3T9_TANCI|nr:hypothetical protein [Tanacetum cinerariifolium]